MLCFLEKISDIHSFKMKFLVFYACKLLPATCIYFAQCCVTHFSWYCSILYINLRVWSLPWYMRFILLVVNGVVATAVWIKSRFKQEHKSSFFWYSNIILWHFVFWSVLNNMQCTIVSWAKTWLFVPRMNIFSTVWFNNNTNFITSIR